MVTSTLETFIDNVRESWGPLSSSLVARCHTEIEALARAPSSEGWLAQLHEDMPASKELYRDPIHGFLVLAHTEARGHAWPPHDHGRSWVIYAVQQGEMEMTTYGRMESPAGNVRLVQRETYRVMPGEGRVYLPGDIHATRCLSESVLYLRLTERELSREREEGHMTRYIERDGVWTTP
ncbi:hypothetical protein [Dyella sp.]|uniref:hypothetical protein n=1 Tax=Dyella sp. TaxID=1869338 RepID=UPI002ED28592